MANDNHETFIREALQLARRGSTFVSPNPVVGALIVRDEKVVGRGWHQNFGGSHAEIFALREAGEAARGATLYCTLEPCNHTGKTPPCTQAIIAAGIQTVVFGTRDSNPIASGGSEALRAAGINVVGGVLEKACRALNAPFNKVLEAGLPFVSLKWAMSADGKIAAAGGDSKWITSPEARAAAHRLRAAHDAVMIGIGTLLADGAKLNCRDVGYRVRQPQRIILDSSARTPLDAPLFSAEGGPVTIVATKVAPKEKIEKLKQKATVLVLDAAGKPDLTDVLKALVKQGVLSVLVEGGSSVLGSFIDSRLADRAHIFIAPKIIGGAAAVPAVGGHGSTSVAAGLNLQSVRIEKIGPDFLLSGALSSCDWSEGWFVGESAGGENEVL